MQLRHAQSHRTFRPSPIWSACRPIRSFVGNWSLEEHHEKMAGSDCRYLVAEPESGEMAGFAILRGLASPHRSIRLQTNRGRTARPGRGPFHVSRHSGICFSRAQGASSLARRLRNQLRAPATFTKASDSAAKASCAKQSFAMANFTRRFSCRSWIVSMRLCARGLTRTRKSVGIVVRGLLTEAAAVPATGVFTGVAAPRNSVTVNWFDGVVPC